MSLKKWSLKLVQENDRVSGPLKGAGHLTEYEWGGWVLEEFFMNVNERFIAKIP